MVEVEVEAMRARGPGGDSGAIHVPVLGDEVEYEAIREVFGERFPDVWLNSTKAITGHCLTSAGISGSIGLGSTS